MADTPRLPQPGSDDGTWGDILNAFLSVEHNADGTLKIRTDGTIATLSGGKVPVTSLGSGTASSSNFLRGDGVWAVPSGGGTVASVGAADGTITIGGTSTAPTVAVGTISESNVTNLTTDLAAKATDANVVHLAGAESISGAKTFAAATLIQAGAGAGKATLAYGNTATNATLTLPAVASDTLVGKTTTDTLTNKRITRRTGTTASSATPSINTDNVDFYSITALAANITSVTASGTPTEAQTLWIAITDNGTSRTIAWGASFEASSVALPTSTSISTRMDVGFIWNTVTSKWRCVAVA